MASYSVRRKSPRERKEVKQNIRLALDAAYNCTGIILSHTERLYLANPSGRNRVPPRACQVGEDQGAQGSPSSSSEIASRSKGGADWSYTESV